MNTVRVDTQLIKDDPNILYVTVEMSGDTPTEVKVWRTSLDAFLYRKDMLTGDTWHVFCCLIQEGESNENVSDVEIIDRPITAEELDRKFKDADTCSREEVK